MDKKSKPEPVVKLRRVLKSGNSLYISLPKKFVDLHDIQKGEKIPLLINHFVLTVIPVKSRQCANEGAVK
jgi:antitoxin component of MazEF toxin-antitoxin module